MPEAKDFSKMGRDMGFKLYRDFTSQHGMSMTEQDMGIAFSIYLLAMSLAFTEAIEAREKETEEMCHAKQ